MRKHATTVILAFLLILFICSLGCAQQNGAPKNIILFIGDGMGVAQITAGKTVKGTLNLERFQTCGLLTTHAYDQYVTDSAAGATALATGEKSYNGAISVSPEKQPLKTALEHAEDKGKSTGLVATSAITHATPACFAAHVENRNQYAQIAEQLASSGVEVLFGGGLEFFLPDSAAGSKRNDEKNPLQDLARHHTIIRTADEFRSLETPASVAGLFALSHLPRADKRELSLVDMTRKAIEILAKNNHGFFLMVEGSQIDWGGHSNELDYIVMEMVDFDEAVGAGLDFAQDNGETLVLVTADHETGGFALEAGSIEARTITKAGFTTTSHTGVMVPIFAYGPGSEAFGGIHDNTMVGKKMIEYLK